MKKLRRMLLVLLSIATLTGVFAVPSYAASKRDGSDYTLVQALKGNKKAWKRYVRYYKRNGIKVTKYIFGKKRVRLIVRREWYLGTTNLAPQRRTLKMEWKRSEKKLQRLANAICRQAGLKEFRIQYDYYTHWKDLIERFEIRAKGSSAKDSSVKAPPAKGASSKASSRGAKG